MSRGLLLLLETLIRMTKDSKNSEQQKLAEECHDLMNDLIESLEVHRDKLTGQLARRWKERYLILQRKLSCLDNKGRKILHMSFEERKKEVGKG